MFLLGWTLHLDLLGPHTRDVRYACPARASLPDDLPFHCPLVLETETDAETSSRASYAEVACSTQINSPAQCQYASSALL